MGGNQLFAYAKSGQIVTVEELCVGVEGETVILVKCSEEDESQRWKWNRTVKYNKFIDERKRMLQTYLLLV